MKLPRGPFSLLQLLRRFHARYGAWNVCLGQRKLATMLKCSVRTIRRWTDCLLKCQLIAVRRRSQETYLYDVLYCGNPKKMSAQVSAQMSGHIRGVTFGVNSYGGEPKQASPAVPVENCERKPDSERESGNRENPFRGKIPDLSAAEMMPPPTIRSEAGREMPNPDYFRVQQALRRARDRIRAARSPEAYVRAIVWREARAG